MILILCVCVLVALAGGTQKPARWEPLGPILGTQVPRPGSCGDLGPQGPGDLGTWDQGPGSPGAWPIGPDNFQKKIKINIKK